MYFAAALGVVLPVGFMWWEYYEKSHPPGGDFNATEALKKLDFSTTPEAVKSLFGSAVPANAGSDLTLDFQPTQGMVRRLELQRMLGDGRISDATVHFHAGKFNKAAMLARLEQAAGNRISELGPGVRVFVGDTVLDVADSYFKIWHWGSVHPPNTSNAHCSERLGAYWALARWAALDGPPLTPEQQRLVNGPKLDEVAGFDLSITVERAAESFQGKFSAGWCRMQAGLMCVADVDHPLVEDVRWLWPNGLRARAQQVTLNFRSRQDLEKGERAVAGCLDPVLGAGEEKVVDYVRGTRNWTWKLGDGGEQAVLTTKSLMLSSAEAAAVEQAAAWHGRFAAIAAALARCAL